MSLFGLGAATGSGGGSGADMPDFEQQLKDERTTLVLAQWPHIDKAWGCMDCKILFSWPESDRCPACMSQSIFDAGLLLSGKAPLVINEAASVVIERAIEQLSGAVEAEVAEGGSE